MSRARSIGSVVLAVGLSSCGQAPPEELAPPPPPPPRPLVVLPLGLHVSQTAGDVAPNAHEIEIENVSPNPLTLEWAAGDQVAACDDERREPGFCMDAPAGQRRLASGATTALEVRLTPGPAPFEAQDILQLTCAEREDCALTLPLFAEVVSARSALGFVPPQVGFDPVVVGGRRTLPVRLENRGTSAVRVERLEVTGGSEFTVDASRLPLLIEPGTGPAVDVSYRPPDRGPHEALLLAFGEAGVLAEGRLLGLGGGVCRLELDREPLALGMVVPGQVGRATFDVRNLGPSTCPLRIEVESWSPSVQAAVAGPAQVEIEPDTRGRFTLEASATCPGEHSGEVRVLTPERTRTLAFDLEAPFQFPQVVPDDRNLGPAPVGCTKPLDLQLQNRANEPLRVTTIRYATSAAMTDLVLPVLVGGGERRMIRVRVPYEREGYFEADIEIIGELDPPVGCAAAPQPFGLIARVRGDGTPAAPCP